jgi:hypothetical protein
METEKVDAAFSTIRGLIDYCGRPEDEDAFAVLYKAFHDATGNVIHED